MGRGSLDFAKKLLDEKNAPPPPPPSPGNNSSPEWCRCGVCRPMPTDQENLCCKRVNCITRFQVFNNICLDRDILEVCIKARCDIRADDFNFSMESFRKAAYRQYILWKYGKLGRGNRRVVPSCAVLSIWHAYPSPDGRYMGFQSSWTWALQVLVTPNREQKWSCHKPHSLKINPFLTPPPPPIHYLANNPRLLSIKAHSSKPPFRE